MRAKRAPPTSELRSVITRQVLRACHLNLNRNSACYITLESKTRRKIANRPIVAKRGEWQKVPQFIRLEIGRREFLRASGGQNSAEAFFRNVPRWLRSCLPMSCCHHRHSSLWLCDASELSLRRVWCATTLEFLPPHPPVAALDLSNCPLFTLICLGTKKGKSSDV